MEFTRSTFPAFRSILFALSCFVVMPALAQWRVTTVDSTGSAYNPKIVADGLGHLHVSYLDENGLYHATNSSGAWVSSHLVQGTVASAAIATDRANHAHLVYVTGSPLRAISYLDHTGAGWSAPQTVIENLDGVVSLTIGVDSAGHAHIGWVTAASMAGSGPLMYATNASGTWVNETVGGTIQAYNAGALAATAQGDVRFAYYWNAGVYHIAKPHGGSWATTEYVDTVASWAEGLTIDLALDDAGKSHIAYAGGPNAYLRHATKPVSAWITETVQPGVNSLVVRAIDVDRSGFSHVSFMDIETGDLRYGTNTSGSWTTSPVVPISWMHDIAVDEGGYPHIVYDMEGAIRHVTTRPPASNAFVRVRTGLPKVNFSSAEWGDFDGDGWMDIAITGSDTTGNPISFVVHNREGYLVGLNLGLVGVLQGATEWGDYDGDGDLDLVIIGKNALNQPTANIYRNDSYQSFVNIQAGLTGFYNGGVSWGDYDLDGDLDLLITGATGNLPMTNPMTKLYRNDGNARFTEVTTAGLPGAEYSSVAWGDYDKDGQLDILLAGSASTLVIKNYGSDVFMDMGMGLLGVRNASARWGDYDGNGYLDIVVSGRISGPSSVARIYRNVVGAFVDASIPIPGIASGAVEWGDLDNDGAFDLILSGEGTTEILTKVYRNNKDGSFAEMPTSLPALVYGSVDLGDYDRDGDLDVLVTGQDVTFGKVADVYRNESATANTRPSRPTISLQVITYDGAQLYWNAATDEQTSPNGLTYNLRVGTTPGGNDVMSGMSRPTGERMIPAMGNVGHRRVFNLNGLTPGTRYYWSVQAVDQAFSGSQFSAESTFVTPQPVYFTEISTSIPGYANGSVAWGDSDNDGDLDLLITGRTSSALRATIYRNDGGGVFTDIVAGFRGVSPGHAFWGDHDNDGDLDVLISGIDSTHDCFTDIYTNMGSGVFIRSQLEPSYSVADGWYDYDGDGALDIVYSYGTRVYTASEHAADIGDIDQDGDLDRIRMTSECTDAPFDPGDPGSWGSQSCIRYLALIRNGIEGTGGTDYLGGQMGEALYTHPRFIDFDNDGDLDIHFGFYKYVPAGYTGYVWREATLTTLSNIMRNEGATFSLLDSTGLSFVSGCSAWGDFDNDGYPDVVLGGYGRTSEGEGPAVYTLLHRNNGNGTFSTLSAQFIGLREASLAWGNYDGDSDLDLVVMGQDTNGVLMTRLYRGEQSRANWLPAPPTGLRSDVVGESVILSWNASTDRETQSSGLGYNVRVGTTPGGCEIVAPHAASNGLRRIAGRGNAGQQLHWTIRNLPAGVTIYWSVQAIDQSYQGSVFAPEAAFQSRPKLFQRTSLVAREVAPEYVLPGDVDADGDLDLLVGQEGSVYNGSPGDVVLLLNEGGGSYSEHILDPLLKDLRCAQWWDRDGDGDLDLLVVAKLDANVVVTELHNSGGGTFLRGAQIPTGAKTSKAIWADMDNDTNPEIVVCRSGSDSSLIIFEPSAGNNAVHFVEPSVQASDFVLLDYDADLDVDIIVITPEGIVFLRNQGGHHFERSVLIPEGLYNASIACSDVNADGVADIFVSGNQSAQAGTVNERLAFYLSAPNGEYQSADLELPQMREGIFLIADLNNDGRVDVFLRGIDKRTSEGWNGSSSTYDVIVSGLLLQLDGGVYMDESHLLTGSYVQKHAALGDINNDGRMDIVSIESDTIVCYVNGCETANMPPTAPGALTTSVTGTLVRFQWGQSSDLITSSSALGYVLRIGTTPGGSDVVAPHALMAGTRQLVCDASLLLRTSAMLSGFKPNATYFWSVQAVDGASMGSAFSTEGSFATGTFAPSILSVRDVPFDLGKRVTIDWSASILDTNIAVLNSYSIWRSVPSGAPAPFTKRTESSHAPFGLAMRKASTQAGDFVWEWMGTQEAHRLARYSFTSPTLYDSSSYGDAPHYYLVSAHTDQPGVFYDSPLDSGHSVDNLIVTLPKNVKTAATSYDPEIVSISDIPHDEGGDVTLVWRSSPLDSVGHAISHYSVWRTYGGPGQEAWEMIAEQEAHHFAMYSLTAPTLFDSVQGTMATHRFMVSAHTDNPNIFYDSNVDGGYSVDNLPPPAPMYLSGASYPSEVRLHWGPTRAQDVRTYLIYRSSAPGIDPLLQEPFALAEDTLFADRTPVSGQTQYYRVFARDIHGNMSPGSNEIAVLASGVSRVNAEIPTEHALAQNYPNPFNPSTMLEFDVPVEDRIVLQVFDVLGQHLRTIVDEVLPAGRFRIAWNAQGLSSGVYYCRMQSGTFAATRKLVLVR